MAMHIIVVQMRADYHGTYKNGRQNYKNWREYQVATKPHETEEAAWKEFREAGSFKNYTGRKMSASSYPVSGYEAMIKEGRLKKFKVTITEHRTYEVSAESYEEAMNTDEVVFENPCQYDYGGRDVTEI